MKTIAYLTYKIINEFYVRLLRPKDAHTIATFHGQLGSNLNIVRFDFDCKYTHFGDRMFLIPLIISLISDGYEVRLSSEDNITNQILTTIYNIKPLKYDITDDSDLNVILKQSALSLHSRIKNTIIVDFNYTKINQKITDELIFSFYHLIQKNFFKFHKPLELKKNYSNYLKFIIKNKKYFIFNNYLSSGAFRKTKIKESMLVEKCKSLKNQGYKIIHIGSHEDKACDLKFYEFVDIDLRGLLGIEDLVAIIQSDQIVGAITYDNFIMHLMGFYNKYAYVVFRGRFLKHNRIHHLRHINNTFFFDPTKISYLKNSICIN